MDINRNFRFRLKDEQITPDLTNRVIDLMTYSKHCQTKYVGCYCGESVSRIEINEEKARPAYFERRVTDLAMQRKTWPVLAEKGLEYPVSGVGRHSLQVEDQEAKWISHKLTSLDVGLEFATIEDSLAASHLKLTPELIKEYMTQIHLDFWATRETHLKHHPKLRI